MVRVGIFGATGYTGHELIQLISSHPGAEIVSLASQSQAGVEVTLPNNPHFVKDLRAPRRSLKLVSLEQGLDSQIDCLFMCLSHGEGAKIAAQALARGIRVIDLSADFRLKSIAQFETVYNSKHPAPEALEHFTYGLPELFRNEIRSARACANPGCYPTTVALATAPFLKHGLLQQKASIIVDAKSGVSGAGRRPTDTNHFVAVHDNFRPYNVGRTHRHVPEMEQTLSEFSVNFSNKIIFTPGLLPIVRGMLSSVYVPLNKSLSQDDLAEFLQSYYADEPFVSVLSDGRATPDLASVRGTNSAILSVHALDTTALVLCAIDNLGKGASGQAVQNFNLMMGFEESDGLTKSAAYH
ncbi:N-acetyl-gamma-glutamyl-phosphate reductase [bacterium]|nr:N-acetyl-gamma-glutamyl-phosphate reductase [bacterium]